MQQVMEASEREQLDLVRPNVLSVPPCPALSRSHTHTHTHTHTQPQPQPPLHTRVHILLFLPLEGNAPSSASADGDAASGAGHAVTAGRRGDGGGARSRCPGSVSAGIPPAATAAAAGGAASLATAVRRGCCCNASVNTTTRPQEIALLRFGTITDHGEDRLTPFLPHLSSLCRQVKAHPNP